MPPWSQEEKIGQKEFSLRCQHRRFWEQSEIHVHISLCRNLATRTCILCDVKFQFGPPGGAAWRGSKFDHQMDPALARNLATWERHLPCLQKNGRQVAPHALPYCLGLFYWHHQLVSSWYIHSVTYTRTHVQGGPGKKGDRLVRSEHQHPFRDNKDVKSMNIFSLK